MSGENGNAMNGRNGNSMNGTNGNGLNGANGNGASRPALRGEAIETAVLGAGPAGLTAAHVLARRGRPGVVFEAVMFAVRDHGLAALKEPATAERLKRCDATARIAINQRIEKLGLEP